MKLSKYIDKVMCKNISLQDKGFYIYLVSRMDEYNTVSIRLKDLVKGTKLCERTCRSTLIRLQEHKLVEVELEYIKNKNHNYTVRHIIII